MAMQQQKTARRRRNNFKSGYLQVALLVSVAGCSLVREPHVTVGVICAGGVECHKVQAEIKEALDLLTDDTGVTLEVLEQGDEPREYCPALGEARTDFWRYYASITLGSPLPELVVVLTPYPAPMCPFDWEDMFGLIGRADGIGTIWKLQGTGIPSVVYARLNDDKQMGTTTIAHEIAHALGATHISSGLMKSSNDQMNGIEHLDFWSVLEIFFARIF